MMRGFAFALALFAAACGQSNTAPSADPTAQPPALAPTGEAPQTAEEATAQDTCAAAAHQNVIGRMASSVDQSALPADARTVTPDSVVTQDFRPERLNLLTDADGRIVLLSCY